VTGEAQGDVELANDILFRVMRQTLLMVRRVGTILAKRSGRCKNLKSRVMVARDAQVADDRCRASNHTDG